LSIWGDQFEPGDDLQKILVGTKNREHFPDDIEG